MKHFQMYHLAELWHLFSFRGTSRIEKILLGLLISLAALVSFLWGWWDIPLISPLTGQSVFRFLSSETSSQNSGKIVYGFLPFWNTTAKLQPELSHLAYFSLTINDDGSIATTDADGNSEPGYLRLQSDILLSIISSQPTHQEIVFTQFDNDDIEAFLSSEEAQERFLSELDALLLAYPFTGVNIDIEYSGGVTDDLRAAYVSFIDKLNQHLDQKYNQVRLSVDLYASAASRKTIWDVAAIEPHIDYFVVMAYDFHRSSSIVAGPVAPLFGGKKEWDSDISSNIQAFLKLVPSHKIVLGIPFYGYEWQTTSRNSQAHTFPNTGATASFKRVNELLGQKEALKVQEHWNETALSPYLSYEKDDAIYVVYYENSRSISYKLDYVNQLDLGGIAIWALGYEGDTRELWDVINRKLLQTDSSSQ